MSSTSLSEKGTLLELLAKMGGEHEYLSIGAEGEVLKKTAVANLFRNPPRATDATRQSKTRPFINIQS